MRGIVFDIQRFALHDGPGIRTTVFLKGCPLRCLWCHNPESQSPHPQLAFNAAGCDDCQECTAVCRRGVHQVHIGNHRVDFSSCAAEGYCVDACPHHALEMIGREMTVDEVMQDVLPDAPYYERSGGGLTLSGGEPLQQHRFARAILRAAKDAGLDTCLDTSGAVSRARLSAVMAHTDLFLFDFKATDSNEHRRLTGIGNEEILQNLDYLYGCGARIVLRCPLVPGINDGRTHLEGIARLTERYPDLVAVQLLPYHNMGRDKAARIGAINPLSDLPTADEATRYEWIAALHALGCTRAEIG